MIRISRGAEPAALAAIRARELPRIRAIAAVRRPSSEDIGSAYQAVKETLWREQSLKCCYCESQEQQARNDVEHFRPKARAIRTPGCAEDYGYWWLAWSWENLLFSCRNCNQAPAKLDKFPLAPGSEPLFAEQGPPGKEHPLLIDPAVESGVAHIQFVWTVAGTVATGKWVPRPRSGSHKGEWTIKACRLDRPELLDRYGFHVERFIWPLLQEALAAIHEGRTDDAQWEWKRAVLILLGSHQPYTGLSYDVLDHWVPADVRAAHQLVLPVPPV